MTMNATTFVSRVLLFGFSALAPAFVYLSAQAGWLDLKNAIYGLCVVAVLYHASAWELSGMMAERRGLLGGGLIQARAFWSGPALRSTLLGFCIIFAAVFGWIGLTMVGSLLTYGDGNALWGSLDAAVGDFIQYGSNDPRDLETLGVTPEAVPSLDQSAVNRTAFFLVMLLTGLLAGYFFVRAWAVIPLRHRRPKKAFTFHAWRGMGSLPSLRIAIVAFLMIGVLVAVLTLKPLSVMGPYLSLIASSAAFLVLMFVTWMVSDVILSEKAKLPPRCFAKICGITTAERLEDVINGGATHVGFVFFEKSPRNLSFEEAAVLAKQAEGRIGRVGLVVEPTDDYLDALTATVELDMLQVHAKAGAPRFAEIRERTGLPVLAVVSVAEESDLADLPELRKAADGILFDAKPPKGADLPGGNALQFDHRVLSGAKLGNTPWMLAGGLTPDNVAEAIAVAQPTYVDVSSGVEMDGMRGSKDPQKIASFLAAVAEA